MFSFFSRKKDYPAILLKKLGPEIAHSIMRAVLLLDALLLVLIEKGIINVKELDDKLSLPPEEFAKKVIEKIHSKLK
jgi:hypothetical protein